MTSDYLIVRGDDMFAHGVNASARTRLAAAALLLLAGLTLQVPRATANTDQSSDDALVAAGQSLLDAERLAGDARDEALAAAVAAVDRAADAVAEDRRATVELLRGELFLEWNDPRQAEKAFGRAVRDDDGGDLTAAAEFGRIRSWEVAGDDERAAKQWREWLEDHGDDALAPDAELALAWNHLRRDETAAAATTLADARDRSSWLAADPRFLLLSAVVSYLQGDVAGALAVLQPVPDSAAVVYLRGLCQAQAGEILTAAASYQNVAARYPESPLRDHALLAKANLFLSSDAPSSAAEEFERLSGVARDDAVRHEADLRHAASVLLAGDVEAAVPKLRAVVDGHPGTDVAARAQFLLGEAMVMLDRHDEAVIEYNRVLAAYFEESVAASAQYRLGRCFDALGRPADAVSAYQAVVTGYPLEPEAPAAAYLAGVGLLAAGRAAAAAPYFQLVLDRYGPADNDDRAVVFARPEHQELVEASLCLLELAYHRTGDLGRLSGAPHVMLQRMPPSRSPWRAHALLIDADGLAAQGRHDEARAQLEQLFTEYPDHPALVPAQQLLAWTYAQQGESDRAIAATEDLLASAVDAHDPALATARLNLAHLRFNQQRYQDAAGAYEIFLAHRPEHPQAPLAMYQSGLCYERLDRAGDAVDRWEALVASQPSAEISERAWARAGDLYFRTGHYDDAKRCYDGLLANFNDGTGSALSQLRIAQCDFNAGRDTLALAGYAAVLEQHASSPVARDAERGLEQTLYRLGQGDGGVEALQQLVERYPNSTFAADAQFEIARRLYEEQRFPEAAVEFRRVVSRFPGYATADRAQYLMADAHLQAGETARAREAYQQFLLFFGQSDLRAPVALQLGGLCFEAGDYMQAAVQYTDVMAQDPLPETAAPALYNLALCRRLLGDDAQALADLLAYRERFGADERAAEVAYQIGDLRALTGEHEAAIAEWRAALAAAPHAGLATEIQFRIGDSFEQQQQVADALKWYARAAVCDRRDDPFRLSAVARSAMLLESAESYVEALAAYRDLAANASDPELTAAASGRAAELAAVVE